MFKSTRLYSVLFNKCPKCHKGDFFITNNAYNLKKFDKMHKNCSCCGESFERETGFYIGAMYASYALTVAYGIALFVAMVTIFKADILIFLISFSVSLIALLPWIYRKSRLIWINLFVGYTKNSTKKLTT